MSIGIQFAAKPLPNGCNPGMLDALVMRGSIKRGPEELYHPLSNGASMSPQSSHFAMDSDAKKAKLEPVSVITPVGGTVVGVPLSVSAATGASIAPAAVAGVTLVTQQSAPARSRVVHLRNIPGDLSEVELMQICVPFGHVTNFLMLKGKNQAFVEYEDDTCAAGLIRYCTLSPLTLRGRTLFAQFSNHQELKTDNNKSSSAAAIGVGFTANNLNNNNSSASMSVISSASSATSLPRYGSPNGVNGTSSGFSSQPPTHSTLVLSAETSSACGSALVDVKPPIMTQGVPGGVGSAGAMSYSSVVAVAAVAAQQQQQMAAALMNAAAANQQQQQQQAAAALLTGGHLTSTAHLASAGSVGGMLPSVSVGGGLPFGGCGGGLGTSFMASPHHGTAPGLPNGLSPAALAAAAAHDSNAGALVPMTPSAGSDVSSVGLGLVATQPTPNSVLRVIVENMLYPITLDILYGVFSQYGKVLRIITFSKNNTFQILVQFSEACTAQGARNALDGKNLYNGCCTLRVEYSKLATLNVKYNNDKSRDYTNPTLPSGEIALDQSLGLGNPYFAMLQHSSDYGSVANAAGLFAGMNPLHTAFQSHPAFGGAGGGLSGNMSTAAALQAVSVAGGNAVSMQQQQQQTFHAVQNPMMTFAHAGALGIPGAATNVNNAALVAAGVAGLRLPNQFAALAAAANASPVVLVSNLDEENVTCDALFTLFGVYGDVQRVKILFNKKDNALIQYSEPMQAQLALQYLDKIKLWDRQIHVTTSKHMNVQMPKEGQPDAGLTKDFSQSPLHRFKKPGSKNYMNIYPPSATLHLSNIPPNITEEFLKESFAEFNFHVKAFKFFPKDHKMALMQLETTEEAIMALIQLHNFKLAENAHLRVSFSKSGI